MNHRYLGFFILMVGLLSIETLKAQTTAQDIFNKAKGQMLSGNMALVMHIKTTDHKGRFKEKEMEVWTASFDTVEKTRVKYLQPERAKGTTIILTDVKKESGMVEVYTPSNGKTRKLKPSASNMKMIGSEFAMMNFEIENTEELSYTLLEEEKINDTDCFHLKINAKNSLTDAKGEIWIEKHTNQFMQIIVYDEKGDQTRFVQLQNYNKVVGAMNKVQPMHIITKDLNNQSTTEIHVLEANYRTNFKTEDFMLKNELVN